MTYSKRTKLSPHFVHGEISKSYTASRLGIDNTPSEDVIHAATGLAIHILEPIRVEFGIPFSPQSWFRCEELERNITTNSFANWADRHGFDGPTDQAWDAYFQRKSHPRGEAADIEVPTVPNETLFNWVLNHLEFDQLIREFPKANDPFSGWVHVSWKHTGNRNQSFTIG